MKMITRRGSGRALVAKGIQRMLSLIGAVLLVGAGSGALATVSTAGAATARSAVGGAASSTALRSGLTAGVPRAVRALGQPCELPHTIAASWINGTVINETGVPLKLKYEETGVANRTVLPGIAKQIGAGGTDKWCVYSPLFGSGVVVEYSFGSGDTFRFEASTYQFGSGYEGCKVYETNNSGSYACTAIRAKAGAQLSDLTFRLFRVRAAGSMTSSTALLTATPSGAHCKYRALGTAISGTVINETGLPLRLKYEEYGFANTASPPAAQTVAPGETNNWCVYGDLAGSGVVIEYSFGSDVFRFDASTYVNFTGSEGCAVYESSNSRSYACTAIRAKAGERLSHLTFRLFRVR